MEHLTQVTTRDASCTVDGEVVPDHPIENTDHPEQVNNTGEKDEIKDRPVKGLKGAANAIAP